jgi:hypothetical protein
MAHALALIFGVPSRIVKGCPGNEGGPSNRGMRSFRTHLRLDDVLSAIYLSLIGKSQFRELFDGLHSLWQRNPRAIQVLSKLR